MMTPTQVKYLKPGQQYVGRGNWWLKIEKIKPTKSRIEISSINSFGETVVERYAPPQFVELIDSRKSY